MKDRKNDPSVNPKCPRYAGERTMPVLVDNNRRHTVDQTILDTIAAIAERFYTVQQIAEYLDVEENTARRYCNGGEFPHAYKLGRDWLVPIEDVDAYKRDRLGKMGRPRKNETINQTVKPRKRTA